MSRLVLCYVISLNPHNKFHVWESSVLKTDGVYSGKW